MTVRCSDLPHGDELRAHREDHPLQQSRVARSKRGRGRRERRGRQKQAFAATGSNSMAGAKIWDWSPDPGLLLY